MAQGKRATVESDGNTSFSWSVVAPIFQGISGEILGLAGEVPAWGLRASLPGALTTRASPAAKHLASAGALLEVADRHPDSSPNGLLGPHILHTWADVLSPSLPNLVFACLAATPRDRFPPAPFLQGSPADREEVQA